MPFGLVGDVSEFWIQNSFLLAVCSCEHGLIRDKVTLQPRSNFSGPYLPVVTREFAIEQSQRRAVQFGHQRTMPGLLKSRNMQKTLRAHCNISSKDVDDARKLLLPPFAL